MRNTKKITFAGLAITTAFSLTACNTDSGSENTTAPSSSSTSTSEGSSTSEGTSSSTSQATSSSDSTSAAGGDEQEAPASSRDDQGDKSALDATTSKIPAGPLTSAKIMKLGGYRTTGGDRGDFYSVLSVNASGPGLVDLEYVLLDASGKEVGRVKDGFEVRKGDNVIKVTRASGEVPASAKKVRLTVVKNTANSYATETEIDPKLTITQDSATRTPVVSGRYKTVGKGSITTLTAVCSDDAGVVQAATSPIPKIDAPEWTDFKVRFLMAPDGFKPTKCYVGA